MLELIAPVLGIADKVIDRLVPDRAEAERIKGQILLETSQASLKGELAQLEVNKAEAENPSIYVSGWRPGVGWVCVFALAYQFVLTPLLVWGAAIMDRPLPPPPMLDEMLWQLMFGMLGMGSLRTFEKIKGVASK